MLRLAQMVLRIGAAEGKACDAPSGPDVFMDQLSPGLLKLSELTWQRDAPTLVGQ